MANEYPMFEAGDLFVLLRDVDLVFVVDPDSEKVRWFETIPFIGQHHPDLMGDVWIGVFDNNRDGTDRGSVLGRSRIVTLQPHTDSVKVIFPTDESEPFYTEAVGQWQQLANGNLLLTESSVGRVVEVRPDGRTVWNWVQTPKQDSMVPAVFEITGTVYRQRR